MGTSIAKKLGCKFDLIGTPIWFADVKNFEISFDRSELVAIVNHVCFPRCLCCITNRAVFECCFVKELCLKVYCYSPVSLLRYNIHLRGQTLVDLCRYSTNLSHNEKLGHSIFLINLNLINANPCEWILEPINEDNICKGQAINGQKDLSIVKHQK